VVETSIKYEKKDRIAIITINRPEVRNALDFEAIEALNKAWIEKNRRVLLQVEYGGKVGNG